MRTENTKTYFITYIIMRSGVSTDTHHRRSAVPSLVSPFEFAFHNFYHTYHHILIELLPFELNITLFLETTYLSSFLRFIFFQI